MGVEEVPHFSSSTKDLDELIDKYEFFSQIYKCIKCVKVDNETFKKFEEFDQRTFARYLALKLSLDQKELESLLQEAKKYKTNINIPLVIGSIALLSSFLIPDENYKLPLLFLSLGSYIIGTYTSTRALREAKEIQKRLKPHKEYYTLHMFLKLKKDPAFLAVINLLYPNTLKAMVKEYNRILNERTNGGYKKVLKSLGVSYNRYAYVWGIDKSNKVCFVDYKAPCFGNLIIMVNNG